MFRIKKQESHGESGNLEENPQIDFAWLTFIGMQMGYTEKEVSRMYLGKWQDMYVHFKWLHNMRVKQIDFQEKKRTSLLDL